MVTKQYFGSFSKTISNYQKKQEPKAPSYRSNTLSTEIFSQQFHTWLKEAITHPFRSKRIHAIQQLARYSTGGMEVNILLRLSEHDPDLKLRVAAGKALDQIRQRLN